MFQIRITFLVLAAVPVFLWAGQPTPVKVSAQSPAPGSTVNRKLNEIVTTFTKNVDGASLNTAAFTLLRSGPDGLFGTVDDVPVTPGAVTLVAPNQIRTDLSNVTLPNDTYRFFAKNRFRVANWKLDENSGTTASDSTAFNQTGTLINAPVWEAGLVGAALHFVPSNSYVEAQNLNGALGTDDFTVELYIKTSDNHECHFIGNRKSTTHANFWQLHMFGNGFVAFEIDEDTSGLNSASAESITSISDNVWHLVKAVRRGARAEIYIDNVLSGSAQAPHTLNMSNATSIVLGNTPYTGLGPSQNFSGLLDEVSIYRGVDTAVKDLDGLALDGEYSSVFPTGDGIQGGNFVAQFTLNVQAPAAVDLAKNTDEDVQLGGTVVATDPNGDVLTYSVVAQPANGTVALNAATGAFTYTPKPNFFGTDSFTFKANDGALDSNIATVTITVNAINDPPTAAISIPSGAVSVGIPVEVSGADSADIEAAIPTFTWNFGDGTTATKSYPETVHAWSTAGVYTVTLTVTDSGGLQATATATVVVANKSAGVANGIVDSDGDGFSDELETALNTNPLSALSTPMDNKPLSEIGALGVSKLSITLTATHKSDSILMNGTLPVPDQFARAGQTVAIDVGGVVKSFTLDSKGAASSRPNLLKLQLKKTKGVVAAQSAKYTLQLKAGNFADALSTKLAVGETQKDIAHTILVSAIFNGHYYENVVTTSVTASIKKLTAKY